MTVADPPDSYNGDDKYYAVFFTRSRRHAARGDALRPGEEGKEEEQEDALNSPAHSRASGNPILLCFLALGPRFRGDERQTGYLFTISATVLVIGSTISTWSSSCT